MNMIRIRSNLKSSNEFSAQTKVGNVTKTLTVKLERSKVPGQETELINEITEEEYKALKSDESGIFKALIKSGDLQVIQDGEEDEEVTHSSEDLEAYATEKLEEYKTGEGAELLKNSIAEVRKDLEDQFTAQYEAGLKDAKTAFEAKAKVEREEAVKKAVNEVKEGLIKKHNTEKNKGKINKW